MSVAVPLDRSWLAAHPLPAHDEETTKNSRGRVLAIGGSRQVPGALRLTGEAALRAGAGKLNMATIEAAATMLGMLVPEAGVVALAEDGEGDIALDRTGDLLRSIERCDAIVLGPGMSSREAAARLIDFVLANLPTETMLVLDAAAIAGAGPLSERLAAIGDRLVLTPHRGEMAALRACTEDDIAADPERAVIETARRLQAVVLLKGSNTLIASADGGLLDYAGGGVGLATSGSGDVLAGAIAGLISRGALPLAAAAWGVWLHGEAGQIAAAKQGSIGFLARDLPPEFPGLLPR